MLVGKPVRNTRYISTHAGIKLDHYATDLKRTTVRRHKIRWPLLRLHIHRYIRTRTRMYISVPVRYTYANANIARRSLNAHARVRAHHRVYLSSPNERESIRYSHCSEYQQTISAHNEPFKHTPMHRISSHRHTRDTFTRVFIVAVMRRTRANTPSLRYFLIITHTHACVYIYEQNACAHAGT